MDLKTVNGTLAVNEAVFGRDYSEGLVHQVVVACMAAARSGTKAQKNRSAVSGGGKKPWAQKGSGRARAGTSRSPIWRSGGVTFAAQPRNHAQKVNKKQYRAAMCSILSELVRQERLVVVSDLGVDAPKTKAMVEALKVLEVEKGLIVTEAFDENVHLSSRNLIGVNALPVELIDPVGLVAAEKVIITEAALKMLEEKLS